MNESRPIYLDNAATTPTAPDVLEAMLPYFRENYGNPSSMYKSGRDASRAMREARTAVADILSAEASEILFTGSGTESDNLSVLGIARANRAHGNHILVSSIEHKAVLEPARQLEKEGFVVEQIPVDRYGMVSVQDILSRVTDQTILVSVMYANNEIGTVQPITEIANALSSRRRNGLFPIFHTDACQAAQYLPLHVDELGVDLMTLNGSKIYGPKGIGLLYKKKHIPISPVIFGGGQEAGLRSGTENLPAIMGFAYALERAEGKKKEESARLIQLRDYFIAKLKEQIPNAVVNGHPTLRLPNNIHISIPRIEGESIVLMLDSEGIQASTGSACSANDLQVSHVLHAIRQDPTLMHGSLRFSLGETTTQGDCDRVVSVLSAITARLGSMSPVPATL